MITYGQLGDHSSIPTASLLRAGLFLMVVGLAYGRLGWHITRRFRQHWPKEDSRYAHLRQLWGRKSSLMMAGVFALQAGLMIGLFYCISPAAMGPSLNLPIQTPEWVAFWIALIAFGGESLADEQLRAFQANPANKGQLCESGLWAYSRHPNYFFQWLFWVAMAGWSAYSGQIGPWLPWLAPVFMLHFLYNVTGVKPTEEQMMKSRPEAMARYQATTSAFIPWVKRSPSRL